MRLISYLMIVFLVVGLVISGCGGADEPTTPVDDTSMDAVENAEHSEGDAMEGDSMEGDAMEGDAMQGDAMEEDAMEDDSVEGDAMEEDVANSTETDTETANLDSSEPYVVKIHQGVYFEPKQPSPKVGQEVVFINEAVEGKKDTAWTLVGDSTDFFSSEVMRVHDQYSHTYTTPGEYMLKVSPGGAVKIFVGE